MAQKIHTSRVVSLILNTVQIGFMLIMAASTLIGGLLTWNDEGWILVTVGIFILIFAYYQYYVAVATLWRYRYVEEEEA